MYKLSFQKLFPFLLLFVLLIPQSSSALTNSILATDLLGQYDQTSFTDPVPVYTKSGANDGANMFGFNIPESSLLDSVNHRFFISDEQNHRVLVYNLNTNNTFTDRVPDYVLGQPNFYTRDSANTQAGMSYPFGLAFDSSRSYLFVSQTGGDRVTVYDLSTGITNGMNASYVLGAADFTSSGISLTASGMSDPIGLVFDSANNYLFVAQANYSRITVFDVTTITNGEDAIYVLGQANFTSGSAATTQAGMNRPFFIGYDSDNERLFVPQENHRVTVYDLSGGITNGMNASFVLGQANFTSGSAATTQAGMNTPRAAVYDHVHQRLFVAQYPNNRITVYDLSDGITNGEAAINVLGQTTYTASSAATTQAGLNVPVSLVYDTENDLLYVNEYSNNRVTVFNVASITNGENAVDLLGQYDQTSFTDPVPVYTKGGANDGANKLGFNNPTYLAMDTVHHRLFISDLGNNRVLVYNLNTNNTLIDKIPDYVLGQANFYSRVAATTQSGLNSPRDIVYDSVNNRLFVAQANNHRITVFDVETIVNGENAVNVLGQPDFTSSSGANTQAGLSYTIGLALDETNQRLFVAEYSGSRVKVFDVNSITDGENAVNILGQAVFTTATTATTQTGMNRPQDVVYDSVHNRLFVPDTNNHRILVFDVTTITDGEPAINVLGQVNFTSGGAAVTQTGLASPSGIEYDAINDRLFVGDESGHRIMIYDVASITDGESAINVLGQINFTTNASTVSQSGMTILQGVLYDATNDRLVVAEYASNRILFFDLSTPVQTLTSNKSGPLTVGDTTTIYITFSNAVTVTGTPTLELETGDTDRLATYTSGSGTNTLAFTYVIQQGDITTDLSYKSTSSLSLNGGTIIDSSNNNEATLTLPTPGASGSLSLTSNIEIVQPASVVLPSSGWTAPWVTSVTTTVNVTTPDPNKTEPTVVVDYTRLCPAFTTSLRPGVRNNQVKLIQEYLNSQIDSKLPLTNFYGPQTTKAIKQFQLLHKDLILTPWNLTTPTGIWHTTTRRTAATLVNCPDPTNGGELKSLAR